MLDTQPEIVSLKCDWVSTNSNKYEMPVLTIEILQGNMERVKLLLAHNANVNAKDTRGITPLLYAAEKGNKDLAELLIAHNADVNAKNGAGDTPLIVAQSNGHDDVAKLLLAQNPDVNTKDSDGDTPRTMQC
jgi:ankyrin repeat protein